jgi:hypothetical protein
MLAHIQSATDLETSYEATCQGFRDQAKAKAERATPYVEKASQFWEELQQCTTSAQVLKNPRLQEDLISTAGVSAKAKQYLEPQDIERILSGIIEGIPDDHKKQFREELFYRYLLCKGGSFDGEMKNYTGAEAGRLIVARLLDALEVKHDPSVWFKGRRRPEKLPEARGPAGSRKVQKIAWPNRILVFDKKPPVIEKNVDLLLLDATVPMTEKSLMNNADCYLACGELKGGIDPAAIDQRWPAAKSFFDTVTSAFDKKRTKPALFFVAAAISKSLAKELFERLQNGKLSYAANLTVPLQVEKLVSWLVTL